MRNSQIHGFCSALALTAVLCFSSLPAEAQDRNRGRAVDQDKDELVLRTYEVSDLILNIEDRPYSEGGEPQFLQPGRGRGGIGGGGGGQFSVPQVPAKFMQFGGGGGLGGIGPRSTNRTTAVTIDSLIDAIQDTVYPDSWFDNGKNVGRIQPVGSALVVWNFVAVHQQIDALLDALRQGAAHRRTLAIDARWLLLNSDDLTRLMPESGKPKIDRVALKAFTRRPTSIRGITNCFSGQLVYVVSGTRRNMVESYIPVVGSVDRLRTEPAHQALVEHRTGPTVRFVSQQAPEAALAAPEGVGYQPVLAKLNFGALLELRPTLLPGSDHVTVDLKSTITVPAAPSGILGAGLTPSARLGVAVPGVDRIAIETQQFATTLRMPIGQPFLVGGMTYAAPAKGSSDEAEPSGEKPQLYLVLELR